MSVAHAQAGVTMVVRRSVLPGKESQYEDWLRQVQQVSSTFAGHMFMQVLPPSKTESHYTLIFGFENQEYWTIG
jgi:uncharacterized protein